MSKTDENEHGRGNMITTCGPRGEDAEAEIIYYSV
jgi:hypothetical protein